MTTCPIFRIYSGAEAVTDEIKCLVAEIPRAFAQHGLTLSEKSYSKAVGQSYVTQQAHSFKVTGRISRQRIPRQLIFVFDLWRRTSAGSWPHFENALLTVGYEPKADNGWSLSQLVVGGDGRLSDPYASKVCVPHADGRLLEWEADAKTWHERAWLFSIPLIWINGPGAFQREIVEPIIALLIREAEPEKAMQETHAVRFCT